MKKVIIGILIVVVLALASVGIVIGVRSCKDKVDGKNVIQSERTLIESKYAIGDIAMFRIRATSDVEMTRMTYKLNNGNEVELTVKTGLSEDMEDSFGKGKYFIDTGVEMIDTATMTAGNYVIAWYIYDADETRYDFTERFVFEVAAVQTNA